MTDPIPCIKHGEPSDRDPRLVKLLDRASDISTPDLEGQLESLLDYNGQLWATWRNATGRDTYSAALTEAWADLGGGGGALHLLRTDDAYDFQEDVMNNADEDEG